MGFLTLAQFIVDVKLVITCSLKQLKRGLKMPAAVLEKTKFRSIGNSVGVIVPNKIREKAGISVGALVTVESPRPGVVVVSSIEHAGTDKLDAWENLQSFVGNVEMNNNSWPNEKPFKEVLNDARDSKFASLLSEVGTTR